MYGCVVLFSPKYVRTFLSVLSILCSEVTTYQRYGRGYFCDDEVTFFSNHNRVDMRAPVEHDQASSEEKKEVFYDAVTYTVNHKKLRRSDENFQRQEVEPQLYDDESHHVDNEEEDTGSF